ncbi:ankyrin repeat domain-containing protein SOWAHC-like [Echeneis naucrates]|uniref:ankyrin repeat domain-containing protein SOWAHC-like n=1 Tax=Echeneis naucrates TaxID=173247 RepID=UPI0011134487|nr:ankyrin repeat domain-containing protein SOWAHC-like [Echeneis naucrates]
MEFCREDIVDFLKERGGRARSAELTGHFRAALLLPEPGKMAAARDAFKTCVDGVAFVKAENGVKYVCLRKKYRGATAGTGAGQALSGCGGRGGGGEGGGGGGGGIGRPAAERRPGSGYGSDSQVRAPASPPEFVWTVEEVDCGQMGNTDSVSTKRGSESESGSGSVSGTWTGGAPEIPEIAVIEASPLPAEASVFDLPGPAGSCHTGGLDSAPAGLSPADSQVGPGEADQHRGPDSDGEQSDAPSLCGSDDNGTPTSSRRHFIQVMMNTSPQVRRSMVLRRSLHLASRSDSDSASLVSSNPDEERTSIALDPLEHEWMMCASDAEWRDLQRLLGSEPSLILRKDFVTGFTCLHWAAKHGKPELIALIGNFAKQHHIPISVDVRSNAGYTPLHLAAMHNHMDVVKLLVGAYDADVEIRDYNGKKACQYLTDASVDIQDIIGAYEQSGTESQCCEDGRRWRFSKVLQSNLKPLRLLNPADCDPADEEGRPRQKPLRRRSSLSRMKPKLQQLRWRASQILHNASHQDGEEEQEESTKGAFMSRPKTHFFG